MPFGPEVHGEGRPKFRAPREPHALSKHVVTSPPNQPEEPPVNRRHNLSRHHGASVFRSEQPPRRFEIAESPFALERHKVGERCAVSSLSKLLRLHTKSFQFLLGQVNSPSPSITLEVAQDVNQLERGSQLHRVFTGLRILVPEDLNRDQADSRGDSITVNGEIIESPVARSPKVHFETQHQVVEVLPGNRVAANAVGKGPKFGLGILRESRKARANLRPLRRRVALIEGLAVKLELVRGGFGCEIT